MMQKIIMSVILLSVGVLSAATEDKKAAKPAKFSMISCELPAIPGHPIDFPGIDCSKESQENGCPAGGKAVGCKMVGG